MILNCGRVWCDVAVLSYKISNNGIINLRRTCTLRFIIWYYDCTDRANLDTDFRHCCRERHFGKLHQINEIIPYWAALCVGCERTHFRQIVAREMVHSAHTHVTWPTHGAGVMHRVMHLRVDQLICMFVRKTRLLRIGKPPCFSHRPGVLHLRLNRRYLAKQHSGVESFSSN